MILEAPAIVRASSLDALSPTLKYAKRAIIVDKTGNFLGFAQYRRFECHGKPNNYHFVPSGEMYAAGIKIPDVSEIGWFPCGPLYVRKRDTIAIAFHLNGELI